MGDVGNVALDATPSASFADKTAETSKTVTVTGYSISGSASGNYTLTQPTLLTADITPLAIVGSITADDKEVEVVLKPGQMELKKKFNLKDMVYNGKLEL